MMPAVKALPAASKRWLRPMRADIARRPTMQSYRCDRRRDDSRRRAVQDLCEDHEQVGGMQREDQGGDRDHDHAGRDQRPLPRDRIGQYAARDQRHSTGNPADRQHQPDRFLRPVEIGKVEGNEGAEALLHVRDEEIHPIQAAPAPGGACALQGQLVPAMTRDGRLGRRKLSNGPVHRRQGDGLFAVPAHAQATAGFNAHWKRIDP